MKFSTQASFFIFAACTALMMFSLTAEAVRVKDLARVEGVRANMLTGYGIVVGLAGSGDSPRSLATQQSVVNALLDFGISLDHNDMSTRNVAAVVLTAELPPFASAGSRIDVVVSSLGDARSLVGGTLLLAPLRAANGQIFALSQGQISVGGFKFDLNGNLVQKNHPTVGTIPNGAIIEVEPGVNLMTEDRQVRLVLHESDFTTTNRLVDSINDAFGSRLAKPVHAGRVRIAVPSDYDEIVRFIADLESIEVTPDRSARVVVNERTGTVVSGGNVQIGAVTISHGNIKLSISTDYRVSQPRYVTSIRSPGIATAIVPDTDIAVEEDVAEAVDLAGDATVADLVTALRQIRTSTRDVIIILQAIKAAGALHAELIIQ